MKIAIINPSMRLAGGVERVIALQVNAWVEQYNHDVVLSHKQILAVRLFIN